MQKTKGEIFHLAVGIIITLFGITDIFKQVNYENIFTLFIGISAIFTGITYKDGEYDERIRYVKEKAGYYSYAISVVSLFVLLLLYRNGLISSDAAVYTMFFFPALLFYVIGFVVHKRT